MERKPKEEEVNRANLPTFMAAGAQVPLANLSRKPENNAWELLFVAGMLVQGVAFSLLHHRWRHIFQLRMRRVRRPAWRSSLELAPRSMTDGAAGRASRGGGNAVGAHPSLAHLAAHADGAADVGCERPPLVAAACAHAAAR